MNVSMMYHIPGWCETNEIRTDVELYRVIVSTIDNNLRATVSERIMPKKRHNIRLVNNLKRSPKKNAQDCSHHCKFTKLWLVYISVLPQRLGPKNLVRWRMFPAK
jgi:hypothetical protein